MESIDVSEVETHFFELRDRVAVGEEFTITMNGKPAARLIPFEPDTPSPDEMHRAVEQMMKFREGKTLGKGLTMRDLIEEGRRF